MVEPDSERLHALLADIAAAGHTAFGVSDPDLALRVLADTPYDVLMIAESGSAWRAASVALALRLQLGREMPICVSLLDRSAPDAPLRAPIVAALRLPIASRTLAGVIEELTGAHRRSPSEERVLAPTEPELPTLSSVG